MIRFTRCVAGLAIAFAGTTSPAHASPGCVPDSQYSPGNRRERPANPHDSDGGQYATQAAAAVEPTKVQTYVHIIRDVESNDVPDAVVGAQMEVLNRSFAGGQGGASTPFSFELADTTRTDNAEWYSMTWDSEAERAAKTALHVGDAKTLNVYIVATPEGNSWGTFPWDYRSAPLLDGIVLNRDRLPGGTSKNNQGDVAVHETGHWLGLFHTFQGGCKGNGDYVDDTPAEAVPPEVYACPVLNDTCVDLPGSDPVHNFMDYTLDTCKTEFTQGQVTRMWSMYSDRRAVSMTKPGKGKGRR